MSALLAMPGESCVQAALTTTIDLIDQRIKINMSHCHSESKSAAMTMSDSFASLGESLYLYYILFIMF